MSVNTVPQERIAAPAKVWQTGLLAAVIASVANVVVYLIASALGIEFNITPPDVPAPPFVLVVIFATTIGILLGTFVFTLMPRFSQRPISTFRIVAIVALVLSFAQPFMLTTGMIPTSEPVAISTVLTLEVMHVIAGAVVIYLLTTRARA
ncbi:MAG: DUF6069 family protein [bacterium]|nr:DUF6069 family protein [bacterium]